MHAKRVGRRVVRAVFVLVAAVIVSAAGIMVANADVVWEIGPNTPPPVVVVTETPDR
jgi:hypothetical protein